MNTVKKLTEEQEIQLCEEYSNTRITEKELAQKYNICTGSIRKIRIRRNVKLRPTIGKNLIACNENYFEMIDSTDKAYWLGFIAGDANVSDKDNSLKLKLGIKDIEILEKFSKSIESEYSIRTRNQILKRTGKYYDLCELKITRPKIIKDLTKHGVGPNKSKELYISKTIPDEFIKDFVRGIIDSDGCWSINSKNTIMFSFLSSVYSFSEELRDHLMKKCDLKETKIIQRPGCWHVGWAGNIQCKRIFEYLYSNGPWLERKYKLASEHFENYKNGIKTRSESMTQKNIKNKENPKENPKILSELDRILGFV